MSTVPDGLLEIGRLRRAHGVRGQINVELSTDRPERLAPGARWFARDGWLTVLAASRHQDRWLVTFDELTDRATAQRYTNSPVYAEPLDDPDELWVHELIGADVVELDGTSRGRCVAVIENPAADLIELDSGALVPIVFVTEHGDGRVVIDPPAGLFELPRTAADGVRIDVFTLFPAMVDDFCSASLLGKARGAGLLDLRTHDPRDQATDVHRTVDDAPFGGGAGMLMRPDPVFAAVEAAAPPRPLYLLGPGGRRFDQSLAHELAGGDGFSLLCGRYEGVDHRIREHLVDGELSVGDVVLAGGEVAACLVIEAVTRLVPGVMGNDASPLTESFGERGLLEEPQYTRPAEFRGWEVPEVLRSGDHGRIARWRHAQSLHRTITNRPDLIEARGGLTAGDRRLLEEFPPVPYP